MPEITPDSTETRRLLDGARSGDVRAVDRLMARHRPYLRRVIQLSMDQQLQQRVDPSDVVQETQLEAARRLEDYLKREPMPFRLWLRKTAQKRLWLLRRQHLGVARRSVRRELTLPERSSVHLAQQLLARGSSPSEQAVHRELAQAVRQAIAAMPGADREVLVMRHFEGLSHDEIAQVLDIEPATARKRHGRAVLRLRRILIERGLAD